MSHADIISQNVRPISEHSVPGLGTSREPTTGEITGDAAGGLEHPPGCPHLLAAPRAPAQTPSLTRGPASGSGPAWKHLAGGNRECACEYGGSPSPRGAGSAVGHNKRKQSAAQGLGAAGPPAPPGTAIAGPGCH